MKTSIRFIVIIIAVLLIGIALLRFAPTIEVKTDVMTTIYPIYDITRTLAPDEISVSYMLAPGASPHTFEPSPSLVRMLDDAQIVYAIGLGLDEWASELSSTEVLELSIVAEGLSDDMVDAHEEKDDHDDEHEEDDHEEDDHGHGDEDPHYWLSAPIAKDMATIIAHDLAERFPEHTDTIAENLTSYTAELEAPDEQVREILAEKENRNLITLHDSWAYFASEYDLNIIGTFEPTAGRQPTPQYLVELMQAIEVSGTTTLHTEPQLSTESIESFATDNNLTLATLDPIGGVEGRMSLIDLLLYNAQIIAENN